MTSSSQIFHLEPYLSNNISINDVSFDYKHASQFLYTYRGSAETFKSYRREIERLLQWAWSYTQNL